MSYTAPERRTPAGIAELMADFTRRMEPDTPLARIQRVWADTVGAGIAEVAKPESYGAGTVRVVCASAAWAQELDLMQRDIVARLDAALPDVQVAKLRCTLVAPRRDPRDPKPDKRPRRDRDRWKGSAAR